MNPITSIEQLIDCFDDAEPSEQVSVLKRIDISLNDFEKYATWIEGGYTRNCITRKEDFEFILLCWDRNVETSIHDHSGQHCWVYQIDGTVEEKRFDLSSINEVELKNHMKIKKGELTYMHDHMGFHSIKNISETKAMTLHIYASPIDSCQIYDQEKKHLKKIKLEYHSVNGKAIAEEVN
jgi:cysteine dioxygenase